MTKLGNYNLLEFPFEDPELTFDKTGGVYFQPTHVNIDIIA